MTLERWQKDHTMSTAAERWSTREVVGRVLHVAFALFVTSLSKVGAIAAF